MDSPKDKSPPMLSQFDLVAKDQQDKVQALKKITASRSMPSNELVAMYRKGDYAGIAKSVKPKLDKALKKTLSPEVYSQLPIKEMFDNPDSKAATCKMYKFCFDNGLSDEQKSAVARMLYILGNPDVSKKIAAEFARVQKSIDDHSRVLGQIQHTLKKAMDLKKAGKLENDALYGDVYGILQYVRSEELDPKKNPEKVPVVNLVHPKDVNEMVKSASSAKADIFYTAIKDEKGLQLSLANSVLAKLSKDKKELTVQAANVFKFAEGCKQALAGAKSSDPKDDPKKFSSTISYLFEEVDAIKKHLDDESNRLLASVNAYLQQYKLATIAFTAMSNNTKVIVRTLTETAQPNGGDMKPNALTSALESIERPDVSYDFCVAGLENMDSASLRAIIGNQPKTDTEIIAALEAINWAKVGKWGLVAAVLAAIVGLISKIRGNYMKSQQLIADDVFRRSFGDLFQDVTKEQLLRVKKLKTALESEGGKVSGWDLKEAFSKEQHLEAMQKLKPALDRLLKKNIPLKAYYELPLMEMFDPEGSRFTIGITTSEIYKFCYVHVFSEQQQSKLVLFNNAFNNPEVSKKLDEFLTHEEKRVKEGESDVTESIKKILDKLYAAYDANTLNSDMVYDARNSIHWISDQLEKAKSDQYHLSNEVFGENKMSRMEALLRPNVERLLSDVKFAGQDYFLKLSSDSSLDKNSHLKRAMDLLSPLSKNKEALNKKVAELSKHIEAGRAKLKGATSSDPADAPKEFTSMCSNLFDWVDKVAVQVASANQSDLKVITAINFYIQTAQAGISDFSVMSNMAKSIIRVVTDPTHLSGGNMQPKTLTAALEALERSDTVDYDFINNFDQYVKETHRVTAGLEAISNRIRMTGVISLHDVKELEAIDPGILSANPNTKHIRFTSNGSKVGVVAALEAINWKTVGKWGIIGIVIAAIAALIRRVIKGRSNNTNDDQLKRMQDVASGCDDLYESLGISGLMAADPEDMRLACDIALNLQRQKHQGMIDDLDDKLLEGMQKNSIQGSAREVDLTAKQVESIIPTDAKKEMAKVESEFDRKVGRYINSSMKAVGVAVPPAFHLGGEFDKAITARVDADLAKFGIAVAGLDGDFSSLTSNYLKSAAIGYAKAFKVDLTSSKLNNSLAAIILSNPADFAASRTVEKYEAAAASEMARMLDLSSATRSGFSVAKVLGNCHNNVISMIEQIEASSGIVQKFTSKVATTTDETQRETLLQKLSDVTEESPEGTISNGPSLVDKHHQMVETLIYLGKTLDDLGIGGTHVPFEEYVNQKSSGRTNHLNPITQRMKESFSKIHAREDSPSAVSSNLDSGIKDLNMTLRSLVYDFYSSKKDGGQIIQNALDAKKTISDIISANDAKRIESMSKQVTTNLEGTSKNVALIQSKFQVNVPFNTWEAKIRNAITVCAMDAQYVESQNVIIAMRNLNALDGYNDLIKTSMDYFNFAVSVQLAANKQDRILKAFIERSNHEMVAGNESLSGMAKFGLASGLIAMFIAIIRKIIQIIRARGQMIDEKKLGAPYQGSVPYTVAFEGWRDTLTVVDELNKGNAAVAYFLFDAPKEINLDGKSLLHRYGWNEILEVMTTKFDRIVSLANTGHTEQNVADLKDILDYMAVDLYSYRYQIGERVTQIIKLFMPDYTGPEPVSPSTDIEGMSLDVDMVDRLKLIRDDLDDHAPGVKSVNDYTREIEHFNDVVAYQNGTDSQDLNVESEAILRRVTEHIIYGNGTGGKESKNVYSALEREGEAMKKIGAALGNIANRARNPHPLQDKLPTDAARLELTNRACKYYNDFSLLTQLVSDIDCRMLLIYVEFKSKVMQGRGR